MKEKQLSRYLFWAFALAWALQAVAIVFARRGEVQGFRLVLALSMYAPFAAVLFSGIGLHGMGWKPQLKGKIRWVLAAWFGPAVITLLGAALYYLLFPAHFDRSASLITAQLGEAGLAQLEAAGMTVKTYMLVQIVAALTWAPWLNTLFALGEEVGWRGALYPRLKARFGIGKGRLLGGLIWGVWHWPVMLLAGYNYGAQYFGAPLLGPLLFCAVSFATFGGFGSSPGSSSPGFCGSVTMTRLFSTSSALARLFTRTRTVTSFVPLAGIVSPLHVIVFPITRALSLYETTVRRASILSSARMFFRSSSVLLLILML